MGGRPGFDSHPLDSSEVKRPGREADQSLLSSTEVKNGGAVPPLTCMSSWYSDQSAKHRDSFAFFSICTHTHREVLTLVNRFTATGASSAPRRIRILPMNQYTCWPITFGIHRSQEVLKKLPRSIADWSHLRRQTVETNCKNEPC
jgi:hypothetical protein